MDTLTGSVERITYYNDETSYCVLRLRPDQLPLARQQLVTVVGNMPELQPGESVRLQGEWTEHPRLAMLFPESIALPRAGYGIPGPWLLRREFCHPAGAAESSARY